MHTGVQDFDLRVDLDVTGGHFALALGLDVDGLGCFAVNLGNQALDVQDDFCDVFLHTGDR